jgi:hypothetical protein
MLQLVRINHGSDGLNGAIGDIEFDDRNETILVVEEHGAWLPVHTRPSHSCAHRLTLREDSVQEPGDVIAAADRLRHCSSLSSAVSVEDSIGRQQMDQIFQCAVLAGGEETLGKFVSFLARRFESRLAGFDVSFGPDKYLPAIVFASLNDL